MTHPTDPRTDARKGEFVLDTGGPRTCEVCGGKFASLTADGLCGVCDMEEMEQAMEDRDREN